METPLEDYKRRLNTLNETIGNTRNNGGISDEKKMVRLRTKAGRYRTIIAELERLAKAKTSASGLNIPVVGGLFVLWNREKAMWWNGKEWDVDKSICPRYGWEKANEYAKVLGCSFTDSE